MPYGRAMESVDRLKMSVTLYPVLQRLIAEGAIGAEAAENAIAASAEGYAFPTNLDRDPAIGGMAPQSQQALMRQALGGRLDAGGLRASRRGAGVATADLKRGGTAKRHRDACRYPGRPVAQKDPSQIPNAASSERQVM